MFLMKERVQGVTDELRELYQAVCPSSIGHMTDFGFITSLKPFQKDFHFVGNAVTVQLPHMDSIAIHKAIDVVQPGDVLCVNTCNEYDRAPLGELVGYSYKKKGVAGVIIDGCITDVKALQAMDLPIFCRGVSALTTRSVGIEGMINVPIAIDNVVIKPGDLVVADDDGIFVVDSEFAKEYGERAVAKQNGEPATKKRIDAGESLPHINGNYKYFEKA